MANSLNFVDVVGMSICMSLILSGIIVMLVLTSDRIRDTLRLWFGTPLQKATVQRERQINERAARIMLERCVPYEYTEYDHKEGARALAIRELQNEHADMERMLQ